LERISKFSSSRVTHKAVSYEDMPCLEFRQVFPKIHSNPVFKPSYMPWSVEDFINRGEMLDAKFDKVALRHSKEVVAKTKKSMYFDDTPENRWLLKQVGMNDEQIIRQKVF